MSIRATAASIFILVLLAVAAVAPQDPSGSQLITRFGLTLSIVEDHSFTIDRFARQTVDRALVGNHYYADKAPGLSLLAVPLMTALEVTGVIKRSDVDPSAFASGLYLVTVAVNGVLAALAAALVYVTARSWGRSHGAGLFASCAAFLATPFFGWSSAFFAHSASGSLQLIALSAGALADLRRPLAAAAVGVILGYIAVVDLTAAPAVAALGCFTLWCMRPIPPFAAFCLALGGIVGLAPLGIYDWAAFGSPFTLGYANVDGWPGMKQGLFGLTGPNLSVLLEILFGVYRGLLPLSPILVLVPVGLIVMWRASYRSAALVIAAVAVSFMLINASYIYWDGGWSVGPRHIVAMLPMAGLSLAFVFPATKLAAAIAGFLLTISAVFSAACAIGGMFAPEDYRIPFLEVVIPHLGAQDLPRMAIVASVWTAFGAIAMFGGRRSRLRPSVPVPGTALVPVPQASEG